MKKSDRLIHAIVDLHETEALDIVKTRLELIGEAPKVMRETRKAMQIVGERFEAGEYFIPELIFSGEIMKGINALVKPKLLVEKKESKTQVALGTVQGDIHDIGKDMVSFMLEINGFTVHDLGVDVSPGQFVACIQSTGSKIVGLSAFLTSCIESMRAVVLALQQARLREQVKIMIGGNFISDLVCKEVGADDWGRDAGAAVRLARAWTE